MSGLGYLTLIIELGLVASLCRLFSQFVVSVVRVAILYYLAGLSACVFYLGVALSVGLFVMYFIHD